MWRLVLTLTLFFLGSEAIVTCRDNNDHEVDWYILYKAPGEKIPDPQNPQTKIYKREIKYIYIDSTQRVDMVPGTTNYKNLIDSSAALGNTLRPILKSVKDMPRNFGFLSYSDQPPGCSANTDIFGHSKGVLMVEKNNYGVWLLHSMPQFPFRRDQNKFWPESGFKNAQTFICVTFPYDQFKNIGNHLQYIGAFPFDYDIPNDFHQELIKATKWVQVNPPRTLQMLTSKEHQNFYSIAKQQSEHLTVGDLYFTIAQVIDSDVAVQTWGCQAGRAPSYCSDPNHRVYNIQNINTNTGVGSWTPSNDHSKWCVTKNQNKHWTCIADVNRAKTQYERRGGALCINNQRIRDMFLNFAGLTEDCPPTIRHGFHIMDIDPDCGPSPDFSTDTRMG
ncbi:deoxyribonuclease-2-beta-like [Maylandia zebra]|uniref:Deoxyribonuclease-2-alpha n=1 Tax=Maylandia zebra TaxID=106582 RepID=A0A3P9DB09_9CICH|nr:deoxyribonuclease-2-beta-like [Maylandia zebra]XP_004561934.1 deoxyribonuclease-2-beta-like [Maylandia zebra]XP_026032788.1 deoxyribonuclease-2-beta-like [Astatotilapia calliptera]XP_026032789.1 deoxyribonuclease-2-beta-like [Astatotilapia calliptera]